MIIWDRLGSFRKYCFCTVTTVWEALKVWPEGGFGYLPSTDHRTETGCWCHGPQFDASNTWVHCQEQDVAAVSNRAGVSATARRGRQCHRFWSAAVVSPSGGWSCWEKGATSSSVCSVWTERLCSSSSTHLFFLFFFLFLLHYFCCTFALYFFFPLTCPFANLGCHLNQCSGMVTPAVGHIRFPAGKATCDRGNKSQTQMQSIAQSPVCGHFSHGTFHMVPADVGFIWLKPRCHSMEKQSCHC